MSDQFPYGQPPQDPYGQPPQSPAQPPAAYQPGSYSERYAGTEHDPGFGPPAGYSAAPAYGSVGMRHPDKRPGTVTAAAVITLVFSVLGLIGGILGAVLAAAGRSDFVDEINKRAVDDQNTRDLLKDVSADDIVNIVIGIAVVFAVWCAIAALLGVLVLRRSKIARVLLVISAGVTALLSLLAILSGISAVTLIAAVAVIVLLFTGGANDWFARRGRVGFPQT